MDIHTAIAYESTTDEVLLESLQVMLLAVNIKIRGKNITVYYSYRRFPLLLIQIQQLYDIQS
jgi:hypothetical protein